MGHIETAAKSLFDRVHDLRLTSKNIDSDISQCFGEFIGIVNNFKQDYNVYNDTIFNSIENVGREHLQKRHYRDLLIIMTSNLQSIIDWNHQK